MSSIKKKIKELMPDRLYYAIKIIRKYPHYLKAKIKHGKTDLPNFEFYSDEETVNLIAENRKSLARFGDGEFMWIRGEEIGGFQNFSSELQQRLIEVLTQDVPELLIGIPRLAFDSRRCNLISKMGWNITRYESLPKIVGYFNQNKVYSDANISRPYIDYKRNENFEAKFKNLKRMWDKRDIVIVEGEQTKLGMGNDLLSNANSIRRIICPSVNAFCKLDEIEASIAKNVGKDELILAALGPTATVLAYDMCKAGFQIVDIGHIDIEYMWYLNKAILREQVEGKYVNESEKTDISNKYDDDSEYLASVVDKIT